MCMLNCQRHIFAYVNECRRTPLEICFIYLGKKHIYCIFKKCCISVLFPKKWHLFRDCIILCLGNTVFINHVLKFKYPPSNIKINSSLLVKTLFHF